MPRPHQVKKLPLVQFPTAILRIRVGIENIGFVKPASCETFFSGTSISRLTPASLSRVKNLSADFFVKPIVKTFIQAAPVIVVPSVLSAATSWAIRSSCLR